MGIARYDPTGWVWYPGYRYMFYFPPGVPPTAGEVDECLAWCQERFGPCVIIRKKREKGDYAGRWGYKQVDRVICFVDKDDAFEFRMRWA